MRQLKKEFDGRGQVKGFRFTQIKKESFGYIYEVDNNGSKHYEVFKHIENNQFDCVSYPTNKAFGIWAWTFFNLDNAIEKLDSLKESEVDNG